jgi:mannose/fructose/N-acetylgalactosamine-specific phosphotransferase system component IIB
MHYSAGKNFSIGKAIFLNDEDCAALKALSTAGIKIEGRGVPTDSPLDLMAAIA